MEAAINQIKNIVQSVDDDTRRKLITELRDLSYTLEKPDDTVQRVSFYVWTPLSQPYSWTGCELTGTASAGGRGSHGHRSQAIRHTGRAISEDYR